MGCEVCWRADNCCWTSGTVRKYTVLVVVLDNSRYATAATITVIPIATFIWCVDIPYLPVPRAPRTLAMDRSPYAHGDATDILPSLQPRQDDQGGPTAKRTHGALALRTSWLPPRGLL